MQEIFSILPIVAKSESSVLIEGESGTGKELIARAVHNLSNRSKKPFIAVNCGALPETLLESELFGYKKGAFTGADRYKPGKFELAQGGTVFLDEISEMPKALQVKLLRVIQEKIYEPLGAIKAVVADVRFITATNRHLTEYMNKGLFREDLFYRINVIRIELPPLRKRMEDLPLLIDHFLKKFVAQKDKDISGISSEALGILMNHDFPGNIRELHNILEHAFVLCPAGMITAEYLPQKFQTHVNVQANDLAGKLENFEKQIIVDTLRKNEWNRLQAAKELGIHKTTLFKKIRKLNIELPDIDGRSSLKREE
jgi:transcriptional regulator with PAS, ATPase and Fis domain